MTRKGRAEVEAIRQRAKAKGLPWPLPEAALPEFVDLIPSATVKICVEEAAKNGMPLDRLLRAYLRALLKLAAQDERFRH